MKYSMVFMLCFSRDMASGFCYVNDIALAIMELRQKYNRILYIDLDVHHGKIIHEYFHYFQK